MLKFKPLPTKKKEKEKRSSGGLRIITTAIIGTLALLCYHSWTDPAAIDRRKSNLASVAPVLTTSEAPALPAKFIELPNGNYLSGSVTESEIVAASNLGVRTIIRLNGDTQSDRGHLPIDEERRVAARYDIFVAYLNIEGRERLAAESIRAALDGGGVLVHCRNGAHRAPAVVAYWLRRQGVAAAQAARQVGWESEFIADPGPYARYVDVALKN